MTTRIRDLLGNLEGACWFSVVGKTLECDDTTQVSSWSDAINCLTVYADKRLFVPPVNQIRFLLREKVRNDFRRWNSIADAIRVQITQLVDEKTEGLLVEPGKLKLVRDHISWDIMHGCMEKEYENECTINYHRRRVSLLEIGHYPCGWQGDFPVGMHYVY